MSVRAGNDQPSLPAGQKGIRLRRGADAGEFVQPDPGSGGPWVILPNSDVGSIWPITWLRFARDAHHYRVVRFRSALMTDNGTMCRFLNSEPHVDPGVFLQQDPDLAKIALRADLIGVPTDRWVGHYPHRGPRSFPTPARCAAATLTFAGSAVPLRGPGPAKQLTRLTAVLNRAGFYPAATRRRPVNQERHLVQLSQGRRANQVKAAGAARRSHRPPRSCASRESRSQRLSVGESAHRRDHQILVGPQHCRCSAGHRDPPPRPPGPSRYREVGRVGGERQPNRVAQPGSIFSWAADQYADQPGPTRPSVVDRLGHLTPDRAKPNQADSDLLHDALRSNWS